jgi:hypothetical protein
MLGIGKEIRSVGDWFAVAPPKQGIRQWADGRSAKELAKAWFPVAGDPRIPPELQALLDSRQETHGIGFDRGEPERETVFDNCGGEARNADLVLWGHNPRGKVLVSIEAKADESFGEIAGEYVRKSTARNPRSRVPERFELLCHGVLGVGPDDEEARAVRYQLLTAVAGALVEAQGYEADATLFIVHEFVGATDDKKLLANAADLNRFVRLLSRGSTEAISPGTLAGPFSVPGNEHFAGTKYLFIGKCQRVV